MALRWGVGRAQREVDVYRIVSYLDLVDQPEGNDVVPEVRVVDHAQALSRTSASFME